LDEIKADYAASLLDLTFNSKPIINMLTSIAQENIDGATAIAKAIEEHVAKAPPMHKLPAMYLLDSITKNVGAPYTPIFARNLYKTFMSVYTNVEPPIRKKLEDLFYTWTRPLVGSQSLDPVYPPDATRKIEESLMRIREIQRRDQTAIQPGFQAGMTPSFGQQPIFNPVEGLLRDIGSLMHTFAQKLRLEPHDVTTRNHISSLAALQQLVQTTILPPAQLHEVMQQLQRLKQHETFLSGARMTPPLPMYGQAPHAGQYSAPMSMSSGFQPTMAHRIELKSAAMLPSRPELIHLLYGSKPLQCGLCGQRWPDTREGQGKRDAHLDWHFTVNKRLREHAVRGQSRALYLSEQDWISLSIDDVEVGETGAVAVSAGANLGSGKVAAMTMDEANKKTVPKPADPALHDSECPICREKFTTDWDDATEDWVWKNAVRVGDTVYHALCHHEAVSSNTK
ncbi:hypothetical protein BCR37DRAFT_337516, partial [Protomyces lactucae-debilis]